MSKYTSVADTGCEYSPTCLTCPRPSCKHDDPQMAMPRHIYILKQQQEGMSVAAIARKLKLAKRTVHRDIEKALNKPEYVPGNHTRQIPTVATRKSVKVKGYEFKMAKPLNLQVQKLVWYMKSCLKCGDGDVSFNGTELKCFQCEFNQLWPQAVGA